MLYNYISLSCLACGCACCYLSTGPSAYPSPMFLGDDVSDDFDVLAVDDPALVAHFDALAYDVFFRSWE